jgi:hypothetical protein
MDPSLMYGLACCLLIALARAYTRPALLAKCYPSVDDKSIEAACPGKTNPTEAVFGRLGGVVTPVT